MYTMNQLNIIVMNYIGGVDFDDILEESMTLHFPSRNSRNKRETGQSEYEECFDVSIFPDIFVEADEDFFLRLTSTDPSVGFSSDTARIVILNNDGTVKLCCHGA